MSAPRIDTFLRTVEVVMIRLSEIVPEVEDVHDLAYNRTRAAYEKVSGGDPTAVGIDLDNHGDRKARELYTAVATDLVRLAVALEKNLKALRRHMNYSEDRPRRYAGKMVTAAEFDSANHARSQRIDRGEHAPHRNVAQPERHHRVDPNVELEQLRGAVRRMAKHLDREHTGCRDEDGKRKPRWLDRAAMSPSQRDAIDRALLIRTDESAAS